MSLDSSPSLPIRPDSPENDTLSTQAPETIHTDGNASPTLIPPLTRRNRPSRACTIRASQRLAQQHQAANERRQKLAKKERQHGLQQHKQTKDESDDSSSPPPPQQCCANSKIVTPLVDPPEPSQLPRWTILSMWEFASVLNFLHVFRPLLNIAVEFSAEEFETALITPNDTLADIHMPLMKAIPPITRMPLTRDTWITVLCRKLRDWWHRVADGGLPIVASHGAEIEVYKSLDPGIRVVILKALCDIRVEQEGIRNYIDNSLKHGVQLPAFRKERVGGDSQGINYWYEDDAVVGHRLYREIRKVELKKEKMKGSHVPNSATYLWETVATNLEEFQDVSEKLFASKNRTEASLGKKLKNNMIPEVEKEHKRKERLLKKQHRQAPLLDNFLVVDGLGLGRSLRDRKPVTYTFDDYDRSINEAIKITKRKAPSPDPLSGRDVAKSESSTNGKLSGPSHGSEQDNYNLPSPKLSEYDDSDDNKSGELDRSNRRRQRPQQYSVTEFVEAVSDNETDFDSDDDIVGEAANDEEYLRKRNQRRQSSSSEGDEEYHWDGESAEDEEEEEDSLSISEDSDEAKKLPGRTRRETKQRSVNELQSGLRRSKRATRNCLNYSQYDLSESETESKPEKRNPSNEHSDASENEEYSEASKDFNGSDYDQEMEVDPPMEANSERVEKEQSQQPEQSSGSGQDEADGTREPRFLDLNELAPGSGCDDGPNTATKDVDRNDF
ncbi:HIPL1 protein-like [Hibiscus syriacus]|uniref:HIPL1 protein-like n=1 Tax=Hibiscus syriacus TaxID=106335 RepID=A0A6A2WWA6_HIBSY|nr:DDT domain-containing protein DDR4-like [Hibiscus syriacus]KAE8666033.1 HIPL1 protein-like [Hibiscus syriacus]